MRYTIILLAVLSACSTPTPVAPKPVVPEPAPAQNVDAERIKREQEQREQEIKEQRLKELARQEQEAKAKKEAAEKAHREAVAAQLAKEQQQIDAINEKKRQQEAELHARYEGYAADRSVFLVTAKQTLTNIEAQIAKANVLKEEEDRQQTAFNNKEQVNNKQLEQLQTMLRAVPINNCLVCPNVACGRYKPTSIGIYDQTLQCPYCRANLVKKDTNEEKRKVILDQLQRVRDRIAFDQRGKENVVGKSKELLDNWNAAKKGVLAMIQAIETVPNDIEQQKKLLSMLSDDLATKKTELEKIRQQLPTVVMREPVKEPVSVVKKTYKLKNGTEVQVASEMDAGEEIIVKTPEGKMVTISKKEIQ